MYNEHFFKKIPHGAETANILVGEANFLTYPIIAFIRLKRAQMLGHLTEVPVPTRFMFILLGPMGDIVRYREIGRSIGTLMSDEVGDFWRSLTVIYIFKMLTFLTTFYCIPFMTTVFSGKPLVFAVYLFHLIIYVMFLVCPFTVQIVFP